MAKRKKNSQVFCHPHFVKQECCKEVLHVISQSHTSAGFECWLLSPQSSTQYISWRIVRISKHVISSKYIRVLVILFKPYFCVLLLSVSQNEQQKVQKYRYRQGKHFHTDNTVFLYPIYLRIAFKQELIST